MTAATQALYDDAKQVILDSFFISLFYGMYLILMAIFIYIFLFRGASLGRSRIGMLTVIFVMFSAATVCVILDIFTTLRNISRAIDPTIGGIADDTMADIATSIQSTLARILYILSDAIVLWRAWVIGMRRKRVTIALIVCLVGTIAAMIVDLSFDLITVDVHHDGEGGGAIQNGERTLILALPTLFTNAVATSIIACKAWDHRSLIRMDMSGSQSLVSTRVETILSFFIESGLIYCVLWILFLLSSFQQLSGVLGLSVMEAIMSQISAIYPTLIMIIVCLNRSHYDRYSVRYIRQSSDVSDKRRLPADEPSYDDGRPSASSSII